MKLYMKTVRVTIQQSTNRIENGQRLTLPGPILEIVFLVTADATQETVSD